MVALTSQLLDNTRVSRLSWQEALPEFAATNPALANIISELAPSSQHEFLKVTYDYGELIVNEGRVSLPNNNTSSISHEYIKKYLNYSMIPLGLVINNVTEVFLDNAASNDEAVPLNILKSGDLFGTFETVNAMQGIQANARWSVSSGSRTIFTLPKLAVHNKLTKLYTNQNDVPSSANPSQHWNIFKFIARHHATTPWQCQVLFFNGTWFQHLNETKWQAFNNFLFKSAWQQAQQAIGRLQFGQEWKNFLGYITGRNLTPRPYLMETFKHLSLLRSSEIPGITANVAEDKAPVKLIQNALLEIYGLKEYYPVLLAADHPNSLTSGVPIYYSLSYPTLLEGSKIDSSCATRITNLKELKRLFDLSPNLFSANDVAINYFHNKPIQQEGIEDSNKIINIDPYIKQQCLEDKEHHFCASSTFWRGCIQMRSIQHGLCAIEGL